MAEVFLSYAWPDNNPCFKNKDAAWVTELHENLQNVLQTICKPDSFTEVFRDEWGRKGQIVLDDMISFALRDAKILISVLTGNYERSSWCQAERAAFLANVNCGAEYNFLVEKAPYEENKDLILYQFYNKNEKYSEPLCIHNDEKEYSQRIMDLSNDIKDKLKKRAAGRPKVFLSISTTDITFKYRRKIKSELESLGYKVVPESLSIKDIRDFKNPQVSEALTDVQHAFFILGDERVLIPEGSTKTFEELQFEMGFKNEQVPKTVWYPDFYEKVDPVQMSFIERFTKDSSPNYINQKFNLLQCSLAKFISELKNRVKEPPAEKVTNSQLPTGKNAFILVTDKQFFGSVEQPQIERKLKNLGYKISYPLFEGAPEDIRAHRDKSISEADCLILWVFDDLPDTIVTSLVGDLKRATRADEQHKIIYGPIKENFEFSSSREIATLLAYIK